MMQRRWDHSGRWIVLLVLVAMVGGFLFFRAGDRREGRSGGDAVPPPPVVEIPLPGETPAGGVAPPDPRDGSAIPPPPFFEGYGNPDRPAEADVEAVVRALEEFWRLEKDPDRLPLQSNATITAYLQGGNPEGIPYFPDGLEAINAEGEIADRWGRALHFHAIAVNEIAVRSAGPDGRLFTGDDLVATARGNPPR